MYGEILKDLERGRLDRIETRTQRFGMPVLEALKDSKDTPHAVHSTSLFISAEQAFLYSRDVFRNFCAHAPHVLKTRGGTAPQYRDLKLIGYLLLEMTMSYVRELVETFDAEPSTGTDDGSDVPLMTERSSRLSRFSLAEPHPFSKNDTLSGSVRVNGNRPGALKMATFGKFLVLSRRNVH